MKNFLLVSLLFWVSSLGMAETSVYLTHHEGYTKDRKSVHKTVSYLAEAGVDQIYAVAYRAGCSLFPSRTVANYSGRSRCASYEYLPELMQRAALHDINVVPWLEWSLIVPSDSPILTEFPRLPTIGREKNHHGVPTKHLDFRSDRVINFVAGLILDTHYNLGSLEVHLDDNFAAPKGYVVFPEEFTEFFQTVMNRVWEEVPDMKVSFSTHNRRHALANYGVDWASWKASGLIETMSVQLFHKRPDTNGRPVISSEWARWRKDFRDTARAERQYGADSIGVYAGTKQGWTIKDVRSQQDQLERLELDTALFTAGAFIKSRGGLDSDEALTDLIYAINEERRPVTWFCQHMQTWNGGLPVDLFATASSLRPARTIASGVKVYRELTDIWQDNEVRMRVRLITGESYWVGSHQLRAASNLDLTPEELQSPNCQEPEYPWNQYPFDLRFFNRIAAVERAAAIPVLMYHDIVEDEESIVASDDVTAENFSMQMDWLKQNGYKTIDIETYTNHILWNFSVPENAVLVTFDDGYIGNYDFAYPILKDKNMHGTFLVHTGFVGVVTAKDHMDFDELRELDNDPLFDIQSHTVNHPRMTELDDERLRRELEDSKIRLQTELNANIVAIAYPFGAHDKRVEEATAKFYRIGFSVGGRRGIDRNIYNISRRGIGARVKTLEDFAAIMRR
ncbi:MAG: polysaccharide deacetylase family protein [Pseudobacteriovorax sp.]|nr:polysaccharide deacetylase family protein [Pseudobacteriovorax sp.]